MSHDYADEITKQAVARACAAFGFKTVNIDCVDVLADVVKRYIRTVAVASRDEAESSGRVCAGIQDVMHVMNNDTVFDSNWKALYSFGFDEQRDSWKQPFPFEVHPFPVQDLVTESTDNSLVMGQQLVRDAFVPSHLPAYPPAHTFAKRSNKRRQSEQNASQTPALSATASMAKKQKSTNGIAKDALNALSIIEESADAQ